MEVDNEVRLLLRFYKNVPQKTTVLLEKFENFKAVLHPDFYVKTSGNHVWLHIKGAQKKYYSPHLHLELEHTAEDQTYIRGLFGPDPVLWSFFMFLHFLIAGVFLIFSGILYSNYVLKNAITTDLWVLGLMVFAWFLLYFIARQIRHNGTDQMQELELLMCQIMGS
ncbi:hypothetical protein [Flavobacterium crassostreae]|uniref:GTP-binding protein n=1 Tax=Flavobacterium crassostreae TaxID=1763534 RepID=A0A1B9E819_9FLAO|nr:hypothetical protein [Flavobacterium crassostreae]OCB78107.1 hypothetical protein LPBF_03945 [Flavobacterium crassostreae]